LVSVPRKVNMIDYFEVLEVDRSSDEAAIKKSYRRLVLKYHPDKNPDDREAAEKKIREINNAYEVLSNPAKRAAFQQQASAMETKKRGVRIDTSRIHPRMTIPKKFMLCPMGYPDKFLRALNTSLAFHSRDDTLDVSFNDFFHAAKFSLWWVKHEVNNMCRLRVHSGNQDHAGDVKERAWEGMNLSFGLSDQMGTSEVMLTPVEHAECCNVIAIASPEFPGAFRFEAAYFPNHFLKFMPPNTIKMTDMHCEGATIQDFMLVDFGVREQYRTLDEVLIPVVAYLSGGGAGHVTLNQVREDRNVIAYFQSIMGKPVWDVEDFASYFQGHWDLFDYNTSNRTLRLRGPQERLIRALDRAKSIDEALSALGGASEAQFTSLGYEMIEKALNWLMDAQSVSGVPPPVEKLAAGQRTVLMAIQAVCAHGRQLTLANAMTLRTRAKALASANQQVAQLQVQTEDVVVRCASQLLMGSKELGLDLKLLTELLDLPLDWKQCGTSISQKAQQLIALQPLPELIPLMRKAATAQAGPFGECLATSAMMKTFGAPPAVAVEALGVMVSGGFGLEGAAMTLGMLVDRAPVEASVAVVVGLGRHGADSNDFKVCCETVAGKGGLDKLTASVLGGLVAAGTKSPVLAESPLWAAACQVVSKELAAGKWSLEDTLDLFLALSGQRGSKEPGGDQSTSLLGDAAAGLVSKLKRLPSERLMELVNAAAKTPSCGSLFRAAEAELRHKISGYTCDQLLSLTRQLLPQGADNPALHPVLDHLQQTFSSTGSRASSKLEADELAKLARLLAPVVPNHGIIEALARSLLDQVSSLTPEGRNALEVAFPDNGGPPAKSRGRLMQALRRPPVDVVAPVIERVPRPRSRDRRAADRNRSRSRGRRARSRSHSARRSRSSPRRGRSRSRGGRRTGGRSRSRDRSISPKGRGRRSTQDPQRGEMRELMFGGNGARSRRSR